MLLAGRFLCPWLRAWAQIWVPDLAGCSRSSPRRIDPVAWPALNLLRLRAGRGHSFGSVRLSICRKTAELGQHKKRRRQSGPTTMTPRWLANFVARPSREWLRFEFELAPSLAAGINSVACQLGEAARCGRQVAFGPTWRHWFRVSAHASRRYSRQAIAASSAGQPNEAAELASRPLSSSSGCELRVQLWVQLWV